MNIIYPGSFDPFTLGHLDIIKRASSLFEKVYIAIAADTGKSCANLSLRKKLAQESVKEIKNVEVIEYSGLTTDCAIKNDCKIILRGIRNIFDAEYEKNLAAVYQSLADIEIVTLFCQNTEHISSSTVRALVKSGAKKSDIIKFVSPKIADEVINIYK